MELKVVHAQCTEEDMTKLSKEALNQIKNKQYCTELLDYGCSNILLFGIAFYGKTAMITLDVKEK